jgi:hypothetical protein
VINPPGVGAGSSHCVRAHFLVLSNRSHKLAGSANRAVEFLGKSSVG